MIGAMSNIVPYHWHDDQASLPKRRCPVHALAFAVTFVITMGVLVASAITVTVTAFIVAVVAGIALATFAVASPVFRAFGKNLTSPHEGIRSQFREMRTKWDAVWNQPGWGQRQTEMLEMWHQARCNAESSSRLGYAIRL